MIKRITQHKVTTIMGITMLLAGSAILVWYGKATFESIMAFLLGVWGLFSKDPQWAQKKRRQYEHEAKSKSDADLATSFDQLTERKSTGTTQNGRD